MLNSQVKFAAFPHSFIRKYPDQIHRKSKFKYTEFFILFIRSVI